MYKTFPNGLPGRRSPKTTANRIRKILSTIDEQVLRAENLAAVLQSLEAFKYALAGCFRDYFDSGTAAKALTLKVLNLCLSKRQFLSRSAVLMARPFGIVVDPANVCNLACPGCVHSRSAKKLGVFDWKPGMVSEDRASAFLAQFGPYAIQALFCNYGEPLLNPHTPTFIRRAKSYLTQTTISTNLAMERFDADFYVQSGLDYMILSIDGATQSVYERYRQKGNIEVVYRNIRRLVEAKRQLGKRTPVICWQYLLFNHNIHEISEAVEVARDLGVDEFRATSAFDVSWDDPEVQPATIEPFTVQFNPDSEQNMIDNMNPFPGELDGKIIEREFEIGWVAKLAHQAEEHRGSNPPSKHTCHWLYKNIVMDANGRIFPCCGAPAPDRDLVFSVFHGSDGIDSFNSDKYRLARLFFADKKAYQVERTRHTLGQEQEPYCADCEWNQTKTAVDSAQIEQYLRAAGSELFNTHSRRVLCSW